MAKIIENAKGFKVIEVSLSEVNKAFGGYGICDSCNHASFTLNYISVLNHCYYPKCYSDFTERAKYYTEDSKIETVNFENAKKRLNIN